MTIPEICNELAWTLRPGTKVKLTSFASIVRRLDPPQRIEEMCRQLDKATGTIIRHSNGTITVNQ